MESWQEYYYVVLKKSLSKPFLVADGAAGILWMISAIAVEFLPLPEQARSVLLIWGELGVFVGLFLLALLVSAVVAPYLVHKEELARRKDLEKLLPKPDPTPGIEEPSVTIEDAAWALLTRAEPIKQSFEVSMDREHQRIWYCMGWLIKLGKLEELTLYGIEQGARIYRPIDLNSPNHHFWVLEDVNQVSREDAHRDIDSILNEESFGEPIWGENVRVLTRELDRVIEGFNAGRIEEWVNAEPQL